jgi:hypothetical protein
MLSYVPLNREVQVTHSLLNCSGHASFALSYASHQRGAGVCATEPLAFSGALALLAMTEAVRTFFLSGNHRNLTGVFDVFRAAKSKNAFL